MGVSCWGAGEIGPRIRADLVSKDMWPQDSRARDLPQAQKLGAWPRKRALGGQSLGTQEERRLRGSSLIFAQEPPGIQATVTATGPHLPGGAKAFACEAPCSTGKVLSSEGLGGLGEPCLCRDGKGQG